MAEETVAQTLTYEQACEARKTAQTKLDETTLALKKTEKLQIEADPSLPVAASALDKAKQNIDDIERANEEMNELVAEAQASRNQVAEIKRLEREMENCLREIRSCAAKGRYAMALEYCGRLEALASTVILDEPLHFQKIAQEIAAWTRCSIMVYWAEANIRIGAEPFDQDGFDDFVEKVNNLPLGMHEESERQVFIDRALGYRLYLQAKNLFAAEEDYDRIRASFDLLAKAKEEKMSPLSAKRARYLYVVSSNAYNVASAKAFDEKREYKDALKLFKLRENVAKEDLRHEDFREAKDEQDFHVRFMHKEAELMDDDAFALTVDAYSKSARSNEDDELHALADYFVRTDLSELKQGKLNESLSNLPFDCLIWLLSECLDRGIEVEKQALVWRYIEQKQDKEIDLYRYATSLLNCCEKIDKSLQKPIQLLIEDIMRSPKARKACTKSTDPALHLLRGQDSSFRLPWGKPMTNAKVQPWDFSKKAVYLFLSLILPIVLLLAVAFEIYLVWGKSKLGEYLLAAPFAAILVISHFPVIARFGNDEHGSAVFRRVVLLVSACFGGLAILYFAVPADASWAAPFALPSLMLAIFGGIWALITYKDRSKLITIFLAILWVASLATGVALLVLNVVNGNFALI